MLGGRGGAARSCRRVMLVRSSCSETTDGQCWRERGVQTSIQVNVPMGDEVKLKNPRLDSWDMLCRNAEGASDRMPTSLENSGSVKSCQMAVGYCTRSGDERWWFGQAICCDPSTDGIRAAIDPAVLLSLPPLSAAEAAAARGVTMNDMTFVRT